MIAAQDFPEPVLSSDKLADFERRVLTVHLPQAWPHGVICRNCHAIYPCRDAVRGMRQLQAQGWTLADVVDLIEASQAGERS